MAVRVFAVDKPYLVPLEMPDRFRHEVTYFMTVPGTAEVPKLPAGEYWIDGQSARRWLDEGVFEVVSPLDSEHPTEIELSEEQEAWLEWMIANEVEHIRLA